MSFMRDRQSVRVGGVSGAVGAVGVPYPEAIGLSTSKWAVLAWCWARSVVCSSSKRLSQS